MVWGLKMNTVSRKICFLLTVFLLPGASSANAVSFQSGFTYKQKVYEWLTVDFRFTGFRAINDSGQVVVGERDNSAFYFLDTDTLSERVAVAEYQFDRGYNALIDLRFRGFNNAGEMLDSDWQYFDSNGMPKFRFGSKPGKVGEGVPS